MTPTPPTEGVEPVIKPDGYAYRYPDGYIRHSDGREINGSRPSETLPWVYVETASALLRALSSRLSEVERDAARYRYVRRDGFQPFAVVDKDAKIIVEEAADAAIDAALARGGKT